MNWTTSVQWSWTTRPVQCQTYQPDRLIVHLEVIHKLERERGRDEGKGSMAAFLFLCFLFNKPTGYMQAPLILNWENWRLIQDHRNVKIMSFPMSAHMFIPNWNSTAYGRCQLMGTVPKGNTLSPLYLSSLSHCFRLWGIVLNKNVKSWNMRQQFLSPWPAFSLFLLGFVHTVQPTAPDSAIQCPVTSKPPLCPLVLLLQKAQTPPWC